MSRHSTSFDTLLMFSVEVTVRVTIGIWSPTWNFATSFSTTTSEGDDSTCTSVMPSKASTMASGLAALPNTKLKPGAVWPMVVVSPLNRLRYSMVGLQVVLDPEAELVRQSYLCHRHIDRDLQLGHVDPLQRLYDPLRHLGIGEDHQ
mgnify:CR=1 FL=1